MTAVLPHYKQGPANYQVSALIFGGQLVENTTQTAGTTDLTVKPAVASSVHCLGVAGKDANVLTTQTGAPNTYGQPQIDISVLDDYTAVYYGGVDIWVWYSAACTPGIKLLCTANGTVGPAGAGPAAHQSRRRRCRPAHPADRRPGGQLVLPGPCPDLLRGSDPCRHRHAATATARGSPSPSC
jgi:hypothetical protein